jgi:hypothetical protein
MSHSKTNTKNNGTKAAATDNLKPDKETVAKNLAKALAKKRQGTK